MKYAGKRAGRTRKIGLMIVGYTLAFVLAIAGDELVRALAKYRLSKQKDREIRKMEQEFMA